MGAQLSLVEFFIHTCLRGLHCLMAGAVREIRKDKDGYRRGCACALVASVEAVQSERVSEAGASPLAGNC
jgi:hypothetical protein